jgi:hypothetical protein
MQNAFLLNTIATMTSFGKCGEPSAEAIVAAGFERPLELGLLAASSGCYARFRPR